MYNFLNISRLQQYTKKLPIDRDSTFEKHSYEPTYWMNYKNLSLYSVVIKRT